MFDWLKYTVKPVGGGCFNIAGFDKTFSHIEYFTLFSFIKLHLFCIQSMVPFNFQYK